MSSVPPTGATEAAESGKRIAEALAEGAVEGAAEPQSAPASAQKADAWRSVEQASREQASGSTPATQPASPGIQKARVSGRSWSLQLQGSRCVMLSFDHARFLSALCRPKRTILQALRFRSDQLRPKPPVQDMRYIWG